MERDNAEEMSPMRTEIELPQVAGWNNNVPPIGGKGPRARDYTDEVYRLILKACLRYEIFIVTEQAFPDANEQTQAAHTFFKEACEDMGNNYQVTDRITGIVSDDILLCLLIILKYEPSRLKLAVLASVAPLRARLAFFCRKYINSSPTPWAKRAKTGIRYSLRSFWMAISSIAVSVVYYIFLPIY